MLTIVGHDESIQWDSSDSTEYILKQEFRESLKHNIILYVYVYLQYNYYYLFFNFLKVYNIVYTPLDCLVVAVNIV